MRSSKLFHSVDWPGDREAGVLCASPFSDRVNQGIVGCYWFTYRMLELCYGKNMVK